MVRGVAAAVAAAAILTTAVRADVPALQVNNGPSNLYNVEQQIVSYYESGRYLEDATSVDRHLQSYVDARLKSGARKPAVVFDIDDTALSSFSYERAHQFAYDVPSWNRWERSDRFPSIAPTLTLAKHLTAERVAIFFVTGRRQPDLVVTRRELAAAGYPKSAGLFLRPVSDHAKSVIPFKSHAREQIERMGYTVLASVGDQWSDLRGGYAERLYKLPNPMYFIP